MPTPQEVFARLVDSWLGNPDALSFPQDLLAEDVVIEMPLAPQGWPSRVEGRQPFVSLAEAGRKALPIRFDECRDIVIHGTGDSGTIVVEYELAGTLQTAGQPVSAPVIAVFHVHDGRIARWREYHNIAALLPRPSGGQPTG